MSIIRSVNAKNGYHRPASDAYKRRVCGTDTVSYSGEQLISKLQNHVQQNVFQSVSGRQDLGAGSL